MTDCRILTVRQPWASLIASGTKRVEVRSWRTNYRGPIVILAGRGRDRECELGVEYPSGVTLCVVELLDCVPLAAEHRDASAIGDRFDGAVAEGRYYAWVLSAPTPVERVEMRGTLGLTRHQVTI